MREEVGGGECMGREAEKVGVVLWAGSVRIPERLGTPTLLETSRGDGELLLPSWFGWHVIYSA